MNKRLSRFDPEYEEEQNEDQLPNSDDSDDEFDQKPRRRKSRFEDDDSPLFGIGKKRQTQLFDKRTGEAFGDFEEEEEEEDDKPRTPFLVRLFAWVAMLLILFVVGYFAANHITDYMDKRSARKVSDTPASVDITLEDKKENADGAQKTPVAAEEMTTATYKLYIPSEKDFAVRKVEITKGRLEQDIQKLLSLYLKTLQEEGITASSARITDIFKSDDLLYINMDSDFEKLCQPLDETAAAQLITGMLSTLWNNFSIKKLQFYINGQKSQMREPADLSAQWSL